MIRFFLLLLLLLPGDALPANNTDELESFPRSSPRADDAVTVTPKTMLQKSPSAPSKPMNKSSLPQLRPSTEGKIQKSLLKDFSLTTPARVQPLNGERRTNFTLKQRESLLHAANSTPHTTHIQPSKRPVSISNGPVRETALKGLKVSKATTLLNKAKSVKMSTEKGPTETQDQSQGGLREESLTKPVTFSIPYTNISTGSDLSTSVKSHTARLNKMSARRLLKHGHMEHLPESAAEKIEQFSVGVQRTTEHSRPLNYKTMINHTSESLHALVSQNSSSLLYGKLNQTIHLPSNSTISAMLLEKETVINRQSSVNTSEHLAKSQINYVEAMKDMLVVERNKNSTVSTTLTSQGDNNNDISRPLVFNGVNDSVTHGTRSLPAENHSNLIIKTQIHLSNNLTKQSIISTPALVSFATSSSKIKHQLESTTQKQSVLTTPTRPDVATQPEHISTGHKSTTKTGTQINTAIQAEINKHIAEEQQKQTWSDDTLESYTYPNPATQSQAQFTVFIQHTQDEQGSHQTDNNKVTQHNILSAEPRTKTSSELNSPAEPGTLIPLLLTTHIQQSTQTESNQVSKFQSEPTTMTQNKTATQTQQEIRTQNQLGPDNRVKSEVMTKTQQQATTKNKNKLIGEQENTSMFYQETSPMPTTLAMSELATRRQSEITRIQQELSKHSPQTQPGPYTEHTTQSQPEQNTHIHHKIVTQSQGKASPKNHVTVTIEGNKTIHRQIHKVTHNLSKVSVYSLPDLATQTLSDISTQTQPELSTHILTSVLFTNTLPPKLSTRTLPSNRSIQTNTELSTQSLPPELSTQSIPSELSTQSIPSELYMQTIPEVSTQTLPPDLSTQTLPPELSTQTLPSELSMQTIPELSTQTLPLELSTQTLPPVISLQTIPELSKQTPPPELSTQTIIPELLTQTLPPELSTQTIPSELSMRTLPELVTQTLPEPTTQTLPELSIQTLPELSTQIIHLELSTQTLPDLSTLTLPEQSTQIIPVELSTQKQSDTQSQPGLVTVSQPELSTFSQPEPSIKMHLTPTISHNPAIHTHPGSFTQTELEISTQTQPQPSKETELERQTQTSLARHNNTDLSTPSGPDISSEVQSELYTQSGSERQTQTATAMDNNTSLSPQTEFEVTSKVHQELDTQTEAETLYPLYPTTQSKTRLSTLTQPEPATQNYPHSTHTKSSEPTQTTQRQPELSTQIYSEMSTWAWNKTVLDTQTHRNQNTPIQRAPGTQTEVEVNSIPGTAIASVSEKHFTTSYATLATTEEPERTKVFGQAWNETSHRQHQIFIQESGTNPTWSMEATANHASSSLSSAGDGPHGDNSTANILITTKRPEQGQSSMDPHTSPVSLTPQRMTTILPPQTLSEMVSVQPGRGRIFIVDEQLPVFKVQTINVTYRMQLSIANQAWCEEPDICQTRVLQEVASLYQSVPGFHGIEVLNVTMDESFLQYGVRLCVFVGSVMSEMQELALSDPTWLFGSTKNSLGSRIRSVIPTEGQAEPCTDWFSCPAGFQCVSVRTLSARCLSPCHSSFCHNHGICVHRKDQEPECQCPIGRDFWFMGHRCDYRMTHQRLAAIACAIVFFIILCAAAAVFILVRRFQTQILQQKVAQTQSSYRRFSRFDDVPTHFWCPSQTWLTTSASLNSLDNPAFSSSEEVFPLQALGSCVCGCQEGAQGCAQSNPPPPHVPPRLETSCSSVNDLMIDSGKASDVSVSSWPMEPIHWTPFPILHQLSLQSPFHARRPHSYFEGMELVNTERSWTA